MNSLLPDDLASDLLDEIDDHLLADPGDFNPPSRRKDDELNRVLGILDSWIHSKLHTKRKAATVEI